MIVVIECFRLLQVSPQFDIHNQTPAAQWSKKRRVASKVKVTDIFKSDPKKLPAQRERKTLGVMQNLKFHGEKTRICRQRRKIDRHLPRSRVQQHIAEVQDHHQKEELLGREQGTPKSFYSDVVQDSSQNVMADEALVDLRPLCMSTPCAKSSTSCVKGSMNLKDTSKFNTKLDMLIPDPSPNVFRWCDDVFGMTSVKHQSIRSTIAEKQPSPIRILDPQSQDIDVMQLSFDKMLVEQSNPDHTDSAKSKTTEEKSITVLASDTPTRNGDYVLPYSRAST